MDDSSTAVGMYPLFVSVCPSICIYTLDMYGVRTHAGQAIRYVCVAFSDSLKHECHIPMFEFSLAIYMSSNTSYRVHCNIAVHSTCNHIQSIPGCPGYKAK